MMSEPGNYNPQGNYPPGSYNPPGNYPQGSYNPYMAGAAGPMPPAPAPGAVPPAAAPAKRRKRVFMWFFIAVQVIFLIWLIAGVAGTSGSGASAHTQAIQYCANNGWKVLYKSYSDCVTHYGNTLNGASDVGKGIGVGLVIALWVAVDIILGIGRLIVVFARRGSK